MARRITRAAAREQPGHASECYNFGIQEEQVLDLPKWRGRPPKVSHTLMADAETQVVEKLGMGVPEVLNNLKLIEIIQFCQEKGLRVLPQESAIQCQALVPVPTSSEKKGRNYAAGLKATEKFSGAPNSPVLVAHLRSMLRLCKV